MNNELQEAVSCFRKAAWERDTTGELIRWQKRIFEIFGAQAGAEPARPDLLEKLTYHAHERDDLTLDEVQTVLATGWKTVRGRSEREMLLQLLALMAGAPPPTQDASQGEQGGEAR